MHVRKRLFTFLFAALAMLLCTACGRWDYSREAMKAANDAQGQTLRVEFKVNQTFTSALRAAAEDNIQPADVDNAMTMDKSIEKLLSSGYHLDVYALRADVDADQAAAQLAGEFVSRLAGCEDEGYIGMVKAENGYFYEAVLTYKAGSGGSGGGAGDDGNTGDGIDRSWVSWNGAELCFMKGAGDANHVGPSLEKADESKVKEALIAYGDLEEGDDFAFTDVENLVINEDSGIATIKDNPFKLSYSNTTLKTATLNGVTTIGEEAFINCSALTTVTLSENVVVEYAAFYSCYDLDDIDFSKITSIGEYAFDNCDSLTTVDLSKLSDDGSDSLGKNAFAGCDALTTVTLPKNITHINDSVFSSCDKLSSIDLSHVTHIGEKAFYYSDSLSDINIENVTEIGEWAFNWCESLTRINLGKGHKTIGKGAFSRIGGDDTQKTATIFYGTTTDNAQELLNNLTVSEEPQHGQNKLHVIGLGDEGKYCNYSETVKVHYEPTASYIPSTTAYSIPNPAARFILNL